MKDARPDIRTIPGGDPVRREAAAWFARMRADDVTESDRRQWQQWLDRAPQHRRAYERIEQLWSGLGEFAAAPEIDQRIHEGLHSWGGTSRNAQPRTHRRVMRPFRAAIAASVLLATMAGGWLLYTLAPTQPETLSYATEVGERQSVSLADGTQVDLDTDTRLQVVYSDDARTLTLERGRAFFRIAKEDRPLRVLTDDGGVQAVGTEFEVRHLDDAIEVALYEGRVRLLSASQADAPARPLAVLDPGQKARFGRRAPTPQISLIAIGLAPEWIDGRLAFDDTPLPDAIAEFNRYSRHAIVLRDAAAAELRVNGMFRSDAPQAFVEALGDMYGLRVSTSPEGQLILERPR